MSIDVPMRFEAEEKVWIVNDVYTAPERSDFVALIEPSSPSLATNNPLYRDQDRVIRDEPKGATDLFRRLQARAYSRAWAPYV